MNAPRDRWDKLGVFMQPVGGLLTAVSVAVVGIAGSQMIGRQQTRDTDARLYSELMSQREQAESNLRKDMLVSVIDSYLRHDAGSVDARILQLELLAYNFHDSLNLKPLFVDLARQIRTSPNPEEPLRRLRRVAREIAEKQRFALEGRGDSFRRTVDLAELASHGRAGSPLDPATVTVDGVAHEVAIRVLEADPQEQRLRIRLEVTPADPGAEPAVTRVEFDVGWFDFPMIDSTRLANGQRCAILLGAFGEAASELTGVCFPGEYASLKDRPYYDEVVRQLRLRE
jgi:hypothetical protein